MPSRREDFEKFIATQPQKPQSAEWEIGKPAFQSIVIYLAIVMFLGFGMFWGWSSNSIQEMTTATAELQARSITATVQAAEATQQVEVTAQARATKMAEAVATAVEGIIGEIRATATAMAAETPKPSPHPLIINATPTDIPLSSNPSVRVTMHQDVENLPHDH